MGSARRPHAAGPARFLQPVSGHRRTFPRLGPGLSARLHQPNAPLLPDLLGTITLAILAGQNRLAHVTALRADSVNPQGLGMSKVCSEDSVRRAFAHVEPRACAPLADRRVPTNVAAGRRGECLRRVEEPKGLGRLHHAGSLALPGVRAPCGAGLQLVEPCSCAAPIRSARAKR